MADCATAADAATAAARGRGCGGDDALRLYARRPGPIALPALDVVAEIARLAAFCICEGGIRLPPEVRAALEAGADAVVVGTAITNVDWLVREFAGYADGGS